MGCKNCKKELKQIEGKRSKIFCSTTCRSNFWQKEMRRKGVKSKRQARKLEPPKIDYKPNLGPITSENAKLLNDAFEKEFQNLINKNNVKQQTS